MNTRPNSMRASCTLAALTCAAGLAGCACYPAGARSGHSYTASMEDRAARQIECRYGDGQESGAGGAAMWRQIRR